MTRLSDMKPTITDCTFALVMSVLASLSAQGVEARSPATDARAGIDAFSLNCFSPRLTGDTAEAAFNLANVRHDFYDLEPFTEVTPTPASIQTITPGTDRRCEVSFDGDYTAEALPAVLSRLSREGITEEAALPETHISLRTTGTALLAARRLNPQKIAVVHLGTRPGVHGIETFLNVERLRSSQ